jgi:hypothetical protein
MKKKYFALWIDSVKYSDSCNSDFLLSEISHKECMKLISEDTNRISEVKDDTFVCKCMKHCISVLMLIFATKQRYSISSLTAEVIKHTSHC